jgi:hypothetical protein
MTSISSLVVAVLWAFNFACSSQQLAAENLRGELPDGAMLNRRLSSTAVTMNWAVDAGGGGNLDSGYGISALVDGSSVVTGTFGETASFGTAGSLTSAGSSDVFVGKVDQAGAWEWVVGAGGSGTDYSYGVSTLADGSALASGEFSGTASFGDVGSLTSVSSVADAFIGKVTSAGKWEWVLGTISNNAASSCHPRSVSTFSDGSAVITGIVTGTVSFGTAGSVTSTSDPSNELSDLFVAKVNPVGTFAWVLLANTNTNPSSSWDFSITALPDGCSYVTGSYNGTSKFGTLPTVTSTNNAANMFTAKVSSAGAWEWMVRGVGDSLSLGITALADGSSITAGFYTGVLDMGCEIYYGCVSLPKAEHDIFLAKASSRGSWEWAAGTSGGGVQDAGVSISALADGSAFVTGKFEGIASFGAAGSVTSDGALNTFVAKVSSNGAWEWVISVGGGSSRGNSIAALSDGRSAVMTGSFSGHFGGLSSTMPTIQDIFVAKVTPPTSRSLPVWAFILISFASLVVVMGVFFVLHRFGIFLCSSSANETSTGYNKAPTI